jgi:hypothetical protein
VVKQGDILNVNGRPIKFFHFSGFDSGAQALMLTKYAPRNSPLYDLREWYLARLSLEGQVEYGNLPCLYSTFSNGEIISGEHRIVYRMRDDLQAAFPHPARVVKDAPCYYYWFKDQWPREKDNFPSILRKLNGTTEQPSALLLARLMNDAGRVRKFAVKWFLRSVLGSKGNDLTV